MKHLSYDNYFLINRISFFILKAEIPSHVGVMENKVDSSIETDNVGDNNVTPKRYLVDTVYMKHPMKDMELTNFLKDGMSKSLSYYFSMIQIVKTHMFLSYEPGLT